MSRHASLLAGKLWQLIAHCTAAGGKRLPVWPEPRRVDHRLASQRPHQGLWLPLPPRTFAALRLKAYKSSLLTGQHQRTRVGVLIGTCFLASWGLPASYYLLQWLLQAIATLLLTYGVAQTLWAYAWMTPLNPHHSTDLRWASLAQRIADRHTHLLSFFLSRILGGLYMPNLMPRFISQRLLALRPTRDAPMERLSTSSVLALLWLSQPSRSLGRLQWVAACYESLSDQQVTLHELVHQLARAADFDTAALRQQLQAHAQSIEAMWAPQLTGAPPDGDSTYAQLRYMRAVQTWSHTLYLKMQQLYNAAQYPGLSTHSEARALLAQFMALLNTHYQPHRRAVKSKLAVLEACCYLEELNAEPSEGNASRHHLLVAQDVIDAAYDRLEAQLHRWCCSRDLITTYQYAQHTMRVFSDIETSIMQWRVDHAAALRAFRLQWGAQCQQVMQQLERQENRFKRELAEQAAQSQQLKQQLAKQAKQSQQLEAKLAKQAEQSQQEIDELKRMFQELMQASFVPPTFPLTRGSSQDSAPSQQSFLSTRADEALPVINPHSLFMMSTASMHSSKGSDAAPSNTACDAYVVP